MTITASIPTLPPAPVRGTPAENYITIADTWAVALPAFGDAMNTMATQMNTLASEVNGNATAAANSATAAAASADASATSAAASAQYAGAAMWVAATNYATGAVVWSPTSNLIYRRKSPGGVDATDPAADVAAGGSKWALAILASPQYMPETAATVTGTVNAEHGLLYAGAQNVNMPAPAGLTQGDIICIRVQNGRTDNYLTLNGAKVNGEVQSGDVLVLDDQFAAIQARWTGATYGWSI